MKLKRLALFGMPASGKSTIAKLLSQEWTSDWFDTDRLIEEKINTSLQSFVDDFGYLKLREVEETVIVDFLQTKQQKYPENSSVDMIISTGGSVIYSEKAMALLKSHARCIFLDVPLEQISKRLGDYSQRGLASSKTDSLDDIFKERRRLYLSYADEVVQVGSETAEKTARRVAERFENKAK